MKTILLTAIGGDIAQGVARIVRLSRPDWRLLGTDIHEHHAGRLFVDSFFLVPHAGSSDYFPQIGEILSAEKVDAIIPLSEWESMVLLDLMTRRQDLQWIGPGPTVVASGVDKLATARAIESLGLPVPWTVDAACAMPHEYPCIYKPRFGAGGRGLRRVNNAAEAVELKRDANAVFQELLEPDDAELTCAVYRTRDGRTAVLQMKRRLVDSATGWAKVVFNAHAQEMCLTIANGLNLYGSMNIQLRITQNGPRVFEINPRYSSTAWMRYLIGFKDVVWALDELDDLRVSFPEIKAGIEMVRIQDAAVLSR